MINNDSNFIKGNPFFKEILMYSVFLLIMVLFVSYLYYDSWKSINDSNHITINQEQVKWKLNQISVFELIKLIDVFYNEKNILPWTKDALIYWEECWSENYKDVINCLQNNQWLLIKNEDYYQLMIKQDLIYDVSSEWDYFKVCKESYKWSYKCSWSILLSNNLK